MKRKYSILITFCSLLLGTLFFNSCDDYDVKGDSSFYDNISISVVGAVDDTLSINLFNEQQISLEVSDENVVFDMRSFIYHVKDTTVIEIDDAGNVKPLALGSSDVGMVFRANQNVAVNFVIKIWKDPIPVERIVAPNVEVKVGSLYNLAERVSVVPANADEPEVVYESLTPDIVTVNGEGIITPVAEGIGQIRISSTDGSEVSTIVTITVLAEILVTDFQIPAGLDGRTIGAGQTLNLGGLINVLPANADNPQLDYTITEGEGVVTIDEDGLLTAVSEGTAVIVISTTDGTDISKTITLHVDDNPLIDRRFWNVTTQTATNYGYVVDGSTGAPEHLFDGVGTTFLSLVKPGKSYGSVPNQPSNFIPSFTVDMQSAQTFNYFIWRHRQGNNFNYLRVYAIEMEGSNDGENFTPINGGAMLWIPNAAGYSGGVSAADNTTYEIDIPESSYRYVRVKLVMWSDIYKGEHPDYSGNGATSGSTMQVSEFGLGRK